jgi:hypothetical protein
LTGPTNWPNNKALEAESHNGTGIATDLDPRVSHRSAILVAKREESERNHELVPVHQGEDVSTLLRTIRIEAAANTNEGIIISNSEEAEEEGIKNLDMDMVETATTVVSIHMESRDNVLSFTKLDNP